MIMYVVSKVEGVAISNKFQISGSHSHKFLFLLRRVDTVILEYTPLT